MAAKSGKKTSSKTTSEIFGTRSGQDWWVTLSHATGFSKENIIVSDEKKNKMKTGDEIYQSSIRYQDDSGRVCRVNTLFCSQMSWMAPSFAYKSDKKTHVDKNIEGYQFTYPMYADPDNPTEEEEFTRDWYEAVYSLIYEKMGEVAVRAKGNKALSRVVNTYNASQSNDDPSEALKSLFDYPNMSETDKTKNTSKSKRAYFKLNAYIPKDKEGHKKSGLDIICVTKIYGPGDVPKHPFQYKDKGGMATPAIEWEGVTWAPKSSELGASIRYTVRELSWRPASRSEPPRMVPKNDAPEEEEESSSSDSDTPAPPKKSTKSKKDSDEDVKPGEYIDPFGSDGESQKPPSKPSKSTKKGSDDNEPVVTKPPPKPSKNGSDVVLPKKKSTKTQDEEPTPTQDTPKPATKTQDDRRAALLLAAKKKALAAKKK